MLYEWLRDYQMLEQKIEYLGYKLDREKRELGRWSSGGLGGRIMHEDSISSGLEERIEAMEYELAHLMNDLFDARKLISAFKGLDNQILYLKYIKGLSLVEAAAELNYSYNYVKSKHAEILRMIKFAAELGLE